MSGFVLLGAPGVAMIYDTSGAHFPYTFRNGRTLLEMEMRSI
jgi:hypothetical protein